MSTDPSVDEDQWDDSTWQQIDDQITKRNNMEPAMSEFLKQHRLIGTKLERIMVKHEINMQDIQLWTVQDATYVNQLTHA